MRPEISRIVNNVSGNHPNPLAALVIIWQFFFKELRVWLGYGALVLLNFTEIGLLVATYYFLGSLIPNTAISEYKTDYFSFVLVGIAFQHFVYEIFFATDQNTRREQTWGTVESVLVTPIQPWKYALGNYSCYWLYSWLYVVLALTLGCLLLGSNLILNPASIGSAFVISCLLVTSHIGLGLAAMGAIMITKSANPAATLFDWAQRLFCGVFFPISSLPPFLQTISHALPLTYALDALRRILLAGESLSSPAVVQAMLKLAGFTIVLIPIGLLVINFGYYRARKAGTLGQY